jgi:hypothetical protein
VLDSAPRRGLSAIISSLGAPLICVLGSSLLILVVKFRRRRPADTHQCGYRCQRTGVDAIHDVMKTEILHLVALSGDYTIFP